MAAYNTLAMSASRARLKQMLKSCRRGRIGYLRRTKMTGVKVLKMETGLAFTESKIECVKSASS